MAYKLLRQGGKILRNNVVSGGFSPMDYTPIAWYDSMDVSTITKDISDKVSEWRDKSGLGYHLTQGVDSSKPLYSVVNGIVFDDFDDYLYNSFGVKNNPLTIFAAYGIISISNGSSNVIYSSDSGVNIILFGDKNNNGVGTNIMSYAGSFHTDYAITTPNYEINTTIWDGSSSKSYENNVLKSTFDSGGLSLSGFRLGRPNFNLYPLNGYIKEVILYNSVLTTEQITTVNNYLNTKYNVY